MMSEGLEVPKVETSIISERQMGREAEKFVIWVLSAVRSRGMSRVLALLAPQIVVKRYIIRCGFVENDTKSLEKR